MTRRFLKKSARSESYDAGCLSGFMRIFDFRVGQYSQKYLSDRKCGDSRGLAGCSREKLDFSSTMEIKHKDVDDSDEKKARRDNLRMASVKGLMEEEISKAHGTKIQNNELERSQSMPRLENNPKEKNKKKSKDRNVIPNPHVTDLSCSNLDVGDLAIPSEISSLAYDLAAFMVQLYIADQQGKVQHDSDPASCPLSISAHRKKFHLDKMDSQLSKEHFTLCKAMADVAKVFLSQKLVFSDVHVNNVEVQTREFMDALEILSSNKDLLMKLTQDHSFPPLKNILEIQDALSRMGNLEEASTSKQLEASPGDETFQKRSHHKFFRKKDKLKEHYSFHDMSNKVVLKPTTVRNENHSVEHTLSSSAHSHHRVRHQEKSESTKSYFSLKGIKRRLSHVIGENRKGKHPISMDGILDRISSGLKESGDAPKNSVLSGNTLCNSQMISHPSKIGKNGEKSKLKTAHPLDGGESLSNEEALQHLTERLAADNEDDCSKSPRAVASLPEYNPLSPRFNPRSDDDIMYSPRKILLSPSRHQECNAEHLMMKGNMEIVQSSDFESLKEHDESIGNVAGAICEGREEEKSSVFLEMFFQEMPNDRMKLVIPSLCSSPSFLHIDKLENPDETLEKPERPSPISVLEPFFLEDITSPGSMTADHVELPLQPQQIDFEDHDGSAVVLTTLDFDEKEEMYGFVRTVLQASGMSCYGALERWNPSDQLLQPLLFEEVEFSSGRLHDEWELLYDCIIEVLVDTQERLFNHTPWASLIEPGSQVILTEVNFIEDVCEAIGRNFQPSQLDSKDFEGRSWMDLRFEIEAIVNEIAGDILEEVMQETISAEAVP